MKFAFKFSNLLGTVYGRGNIIFTPDGNTVISPVGNRITLFDLKNNKSETLPIESRYNFTTLALAPNGCTLIAVNEPGEALLCSLISKTVIHRYHFKRPIQDIKFSPDGKHFAVTKENNVFLYCAPGPQTKEYNPFSLEKVFHLSYDATTCMDWTSDSRVLAVGGKDMTTKIYAIKRFSNLSVYTLGSHSDTVVACFFEENSLDIYTISQNTQLCVWSCSADLEDLIVDEPKKVNEKASSDTDDVEDELEKDKEEEVVEIQETSKIFYKRISRHYLKDTVKSEGYIALLSAAYHRKSHILVVGLSNGAFLLYEMPDCNLVHSLSISNHGISSMSFNCAGNWIALGCSRLGQLVVWDWQSESFVLKQQGHFNNMHCLTYSPDGLYIATGGEDGKVKIWDTSTGFCFVTFTEHHSSITGVAFTQNGKVVLSSSLDGTVRAYDLNRYRNFRTFTSPTPTQFSCLTVDSDGEIICAGSQENFEIFVWQMKTGHLTEVLAGHEAPVSSISFSLKEKILVSTSWDKTVRIWDVGKSKGRREIITQNSDGLAITFRPDGVEFAVATLDGQISFFNVYTAEQTGNIEGRNDLYVGRRETDMVTAKKLVKSQAFTALCYTADGDCILAAGKSKYVCIYHVMEHILLKKFEITCNHSFDAVEDFINRRKMTEFGNKALIEEREDQASLAIRLPGTKKSDLSSRFVKPEIRVSSVQFSPTGRAWAATSTEGLLVYSLDHAVVFDPYDLASDITPQSIRKVLAEGDYSHAIMMSFRLNELKIITEVLESVPVENIEQLSRGLPQVYVEKLLWFLGAQLDTSQHIEFYLNWIQHLLTTHGIKLKEKSQSVMPILRSLQKNLTRHYEGLSKICDHNKYSLEFILAMGNTMKRKAEEEHDSQMDVDEDCLQSVLSSSEPD